MSDGLDPATNGQPGTKAERTARRLRNRQWSQITRKLHEILDLVLDDQRQVIEAAHLAGVPCTVAVRIGFPPEAAPEPAPAPLIVTP